MSESINYIPNRIKNAAVGGHVCGSEDVIDDITGLTLEKVAGGALEEKEYTSGSNNGMGRVVLRKNLVGGVNTLTQAMINQANTIYVIQYNFTLGENITVPANCVLEFDGGNVSGEYDIICTNTYIDANDSVFDCNVKGSIFNSTVNAKWIKNPTSERLQFLIDGLYEKQTFKFDKTEYFLTKNLNIPSTAESSSISDQPCIQFRNKKNIVIDGNNATIKISVHGQGAIEILQSTGVEVKNLSIIGYSQFVPLDGTTGRGEKGASGDKYYTAGDWGYDKNNCNNTSNRHQYETTETYGQDTGYPLWGTFGEGYIGSTGVGLLIYRNCTKINVHNLYIKGFNYAGILIGYMRDSLLYHNETLQNNPISEEITICDCKIEHIYNAGIDISDARDCILNNNFISNIGHPEAKTTDAHNDPGYGITLSYVYDSIVENIIIDGNIIKECIRKGIDVHSGQQINISNNTVKDCYCNGIYAVSTTTQWCCKDISIMNNYIEHCSYSKSRSGGIIVGNNDNINVANQDIIVANNIITECDFEENNILGVITITYGNGIFVKNNCIKTSYSAPGYVGVIRFSDNCSFENNTFISTGHNRGLTVFQGTTPTTQQNNTIKGNKIIGLDSETGNLGIYLSRSADVDIINNDIYVVKEISGSALSAGNARGDVYNNKVNKGDVYPSYATSPYPAYTNGQTSLRPTNVSVGFEFFDTTLGKPIYWNGSAWVDATGATV